MFTHVNHVAKQAEANMAEANVRAGGMGWAAGAKEAEATLS